MSEYDGLQQRLDNKEVIILDGAIGTQLQTMDVPMNSHAWAATALHTSPYTVKRMHENYIDAGVDVITVNTYSAARHNLEPLGLGELTAELNLRAVMLAQEARDRRAKDRSVLIGGSVSNYGLKVGTESAWRSDRRRTETSEAQAKANLREQAEILAAAGVDLMIAESTGSHQHRQWVTEACVATGLPTWVGFKCHLADGGATPLTGYASELPLADGFDEVVAIGGSVVNVFHSPLDATDAALDVVRAKWSGPIGVYPEAERSDYIARYRNESVPTRYGPDEFVEWAKACVAGGVQVIGGCCGIEVDYIRPLRDALPSHLPDAG